MIDTNAALTRLVEHLVEIILRPEKCEWRAIATSQVLTPSVAFCIMLAAV